MSDALATILSEAGIDGDELDAASAGVLATALGFDPATADDFVRTLAQSAEWDGEAAPDGEFELRVGSWRLDIARSGIRAMVMSAILSASMVAAGTKEIGVALLAAIVPSIFDIEKVRLSEGDRRLLIELQRLPEVSDGHVPVDDLYDRLPQEIRDRLNRYDFADFIERVREAGHAAGDDAGGEIRIRKPSEDVPLISWR